MVILVTNQFVLIETLWNVNGVTNTLCGKSQGVLIETLWNVNDSVNLTFTTAAFVLIETLWNVNKKSQKETEAQKTF